MFWYSFLLLDTGNLTQFEGVFVASMFLGYLNSTIIVQANEDNNTLTIRQTIGGSAGGGIMEATWVSGNKFRIQDNGMDFLIVPSTHKNTALPHHLSLLLFCFLINAIMNVLFPFLSFPFKKKKKKKRRPVCGLKQAITMAWCSLTWTTRGAATQRRSGPWDCLT